MLEPPAPLPVESRVHRHHALGVVLRVEGGGVERPEPLLNPLCFLAAASFGSCPLIGAGLIPTTPHMNQSCTCCWRPRAALLCCEQQAGDPLPPAASGWASTRSRDSVHLWICDIQRQE
jgi:hypothetical protein